MKLLRDKACIYFYRIREGLAIQGGEYSGVFSRVPKKKFVQNGSFRKVKRSDIDFRIRSIKIK